MTPSGRRDASRLHTRTSSDDRDAVIGLLNDAYSRGRLEPEEYQARLDRAMRTGTYAELYRVLDGLPIDPRQLPRPPEPRRPRWVVPAAVGGLVVVGAGAALVVARPGDHAVSTDVPSAAATSPEATASTRPTPSARPTTTQTPTPTAVATPSPRPSATATLTPDAASTAGGATRPSGSETVAPVTRSGAGTTIVSVPWTDGVTPMIEFEVDKPRFTVFSLADADGSPFFVYLDADAGGSGPVVGTTVMRRYELTGDGTLRVKIETEGTWTLTLRDVEEAPELSRSGSGTGYQVGWFDGPESVLSMTADEGNFAVWDDWMLIVNGIGPDRDEGVVEAGRRLLRIESDSTWQYELR